MVDELKAIVGESGWHNGAEVPRYFEDPRDRFRGLSQIVLTPVSTEEVAQIVAFCATNGIGIIPYSGGTGVVAGQLSTEHEKYIVLSLERMNAVRDLALDDGVIVVEAGCILADIQNIADEAGMLFPLSMASEGSCRIGGNLATNAGGIQVLRYGNARDLCVGIEAVMPDGSILSELSPLRKNNTGYDMRHLLIGSEGTLGVITAATLQLMPKNPEMLTVLCALPKPADAVALLKQLRREVGDVLSAFELMSGVGMEILRKEFPEEKSPFSEPYDWYVLIEATGAFGLREELEQALGNAMENGLVVDAVVAESQSQRSALWRLREMMPEANRLSGAICNSDTSVPISQIETFIDKTFIALAEIDPELTVNCYGHVGDGNIHCNVFPPPGLSKPEMLKTQAIKIEDIRMAINETTHACKGSISAEHGIGRLKVEDLNHYGSVAKLTAMRQIKSAIDPNNIMNPGALLPMLD